MAHITYEIPMLSARGIISYAQKQNEETYIFNLNNSATAKCLMNKENSLQEDCAMFYQLMSVLTSDKFTQPKDDTKISDLSDVIVYIDFSGIFDRDAKSERIRLRQLKAKSMFRPEGINIDLGTGMKNFVAFERSASMSRNARLSFIRSDVYEKVKARIQLDMNIGLCQLSKLYAYNGLMFSGGTRIESKNFFDKDSIVIIRTWERFIKTHAVTVTSKDKNKAVKKYNRAEKDIEFSYDSFDGEGFISPSFAKEIDKQFCGKHIHTSFQIRLPYIKGMVHEVDFKSFLKSVGIYSVKDMWGVEHPVDKINLILTDTMFKGKGWLKENDLSFDDYLDLCKKYRHSLYISNVGKGENENLTELNFQFLNTVAIPEEKFRPKDLPLGWKESPLQDKREWLTKATEQAYYDYCNNRKYRIDYYANHLNDSDEELRIKARLINKNSLLIDEPFFSKDIDDIAENVLRKYAIGQLFVQGDNRYLSADLMSLFAFLANGSRKFADVSNEELNGNTVYAPANSYGTDYKYSLLRNPHISKNESVQVRPLKDVGYYRNKYFSHLTDVIMVSDNSDIPMRLGGADFDGDMVKIIADRIIISYLYTKETEPDYYNKSDNPLPLLFIPTEEPIVSDAKDWEARFETVKNTFSSRVGQISNAALNRSILAYDENAKGKKAQYRKETETLAILTGLEIDSAKSGVKPDLSEYLVTNKAPKSLFLKYKSLIEKQNERRSWYEKTYDQQYREFFKNTDWSGVSSNLERLPYYAYELKRNTPKAKEPTAPDSEIFTFAQNPDWKSGLDKKKLVRVSALMNDYEHCLKRIRNNRNKSDIPERKSDIERILFMRGQENDYDTDELYALFTDFTPEKIEEIYNQIQECKWQFMLPEEREQFLRLYLAGERFEGYIDLFCDFRHNGDRVFSDIICDRYAENKLHNLTSLHFENDSEEMTAMMLAYRNKSKTYDYKEAVTEECRKLLSKIIRLNDAVPYVVAAGYRRYIFDILLHETEKYIIDGGVSYVK